MKQDSGNGVSVAVGDVNGDGVADLVTRLRTPSVSDMGWAGACSARC